MTLILKNSSDSVSQTLYTYHALNTGIPTVDSNILYLGTSILILKRFLKEVQLVKHRAQTIK